MPAKGYRDYFKVLGLGTNAKDKDIKQAFRTLARKYHPDVNPGNPLAEAKFKEISEAYEVLSDPQKRQRYEEFGRYWNQSNGSATSSHFSNGVEVDFDDFINDLLGKFTANKASKQGYNTVYPSTRTSKSSVPLDASVKIKISFLEAFRGCERTLSVNNERVRVKIPKGIHSGSKLRVKGKGNIHSVNGLRGDIFIIIDVECHPIWKIEGNIIRADLPVSIDEIIFGSIISISTPDGEINVQIPAGTEPGQNLRLKGKGWPTNYERGDLILTIKIQLPHTWSSEELELLQKLSHIRKFEPRKDWLKSART